MAELPMGQEGRVRDEALDSLSGPEPGGYLSRPAFAQVEVGAHRLTLLVDGYQAYPAMLDAILRAQSTVCLETYIFREDVTGLRFAEALCDRARAGVEVNLLIDAWGSSVSSSLVQRLQGAGVRVLLFRPVRFGAGGLGRLFARLRRRNHRKSLVVDGQVAFTGGLNVSDDYAALEDGGHGWRDTHLRLEGPAAGQLQALFLRTWRQNRGAPLTEARYPAPLAMLDSRVQIVDNAFRADRKDIRRAYVAAINRAQRRVHLTHAYFLPTNAVVRALVRAARRGVDVSVILAATTDVRLVLLAARGLYGKLLRAGVRVFEWEGRVLHAKTAVVDTRWATVGSANLDALSLRQNLEVNAVIEDEHFAEAVERMFWVDVAACRPVTLTEWQSRSLLQRGLSWLAMRFREWL